MINADINQSAFVKSAGMAWTPSPSGQVLRKRFHLVGQSESGQVTSLVRYLPDSSFPAHDHPRGEEILVLDGVFSDHTGDYGPGTHLLNPEGFRHAPFSQPGCTIFVKLQQYAGKEHRTTQEPADVVYESALECIRLIDLSGQQDFEAEYPGGVEGLVVAGQVAVCSITLETWDWFRLPPGSRAEITGRAKLYLKEGAVIHLDSQP